MCFFVLQHPFFCFEARACCFSTTTNKLFIYFVLETTPFIPKRHAAKEIRRSQRPSSIVPLRQRKSVTLHGALCARLGGRSTPLQNRNEKKRKRRTIWPSPPRSSTSSVSQAIHSSILAACAPSSSVPSAIVLPTPDNSKKRTNRLSHLGLANNTRTP